jgi:hypothetical protein
MVEDLLVSIAGCISPFKCRSILASHTQRSFRAYKQNKKIVKIRIWLGLQCGFKSVSGGPNCCQKKKTLYGQFPSLAFKQANFGLPPTPCFFLCNRLLLSSSTRLLSDMRRLLAAVLPPHSQHSAAPLLRSSGAAPLAAPGASVALVAPAIGSQFVTRSRQRRSSRRLPEAPSCGPKLWGSGFRV